MFIASFLNLLQFSQLASFSGRTVLHEMYQSGKDEALMIAFKSMNIAPKDGIYIGDAPSDWKAAQDVGCSFVCYRNSAIQRHEELLSLLLRLESVGKNL